LREIEVKYYGKLTELLGRNEEKVKTTAQTIGDFSQFLREYHPVLVNITLKIAQNNTIETADSVLSNAKVDVFPPFSGG